MIARAGPFEINSIICGDCTTLLQQVPDDTADLIFADPPYNLQLEGDLFRPDMSMVNPVNDGWDRFGSFSEYDSFTEAWLGECRRVLKPGGCIWVIGTYHNIFRVGKILQDKGFWILNDIIWIKTNPMPNFRGARFTNAHETLIWAVKSKTSRYTFHYRSMKTFNDDLQMRSDWLIPVCRGAERVKEEGHRAHPTQKPEELLYRIILATTNPEDLVLDPFAGSGTSAVVAKRLGRYFLGFERDASYIEMATMRLKRTEVLSRDLLEYRDDRSLKRVPFGALLGTGYIKQGEHLWSQDRKHSAEVQADASLLCKGVAGSIHKTATTASGGLKTNGWTFWHVRRNRKMICINEFRKDYVAKYLQSPQNMI